MVDECEITRKGEPVTDPNTGEVTVPTAVQYTGKCKVQNQSSYPSNPDAGEREWTVTPLQIHLPVDGSGSVDVGDSVEITGSFDPVNVGRVFRVESHNRKTYGTASRLHVEEVEN